MKTNKTKNKNCKISNKNFKRLQTTLLIELCLKILFDKIVLKHYFTHGFRLSAVATLRFGFFLVVDFCIKPWLASVDLWYKMKGGIRKLEALKGCVENTIHYDNEDSRDSVLYFIYLII